MAFDCEVGEFTIQPGTPTHTQTVSLADSGITPKLLFLKGIGSTADDTYQDEFKIGYGFGDATDEFSVCEVSKDAVGTSEIVRAQHAAVYAEADNGGTLVDRATINSFNAGNFKLDWDTDSNTAKRIKYLVMGGSDLSVFVGNLNTITSGGPDISVTGVGFKPDAIFFLTANSDTFGNTAEFLITDKEAAFSWGYADIGGTQLSFFYGAEDAVGTTSTFAINPISSHCHVSYTAKGGGWALAGSFKLKSMDSDGFTVSMGDFPAVVHYVKFIAIKGGGWHSQVVGLNTSTGNQKFTNLTAFTPSGVMFALTGGTGVPSAGIAMGWASNDGGAKPHPEGALIVTDDNALGTSDTKSITMVDKALAYDLPGSTTTDEEADLETWDADGVTIDITKSSGFVKTLGVVQFGAGTTAPASSFDGTEADNIAVF